MDTQLLKTFLEVYRTRHFGRAAENLHLSQSAVSARIRLLEEELGLELFTRDRNNIQLTAAGQKLLRHAENITSSWSRARQDLAMGDDGPELLSVGAAPSLWDIALQDWVHWLRREHREVLLSAEAHGGEVLLSKLLERNIDLAFLFDAPQMPELMVVEIMPVPLIMVATRPNLKTEEALRDYVMVDWGTSFAITHARYFPDMPTPHARVGLGRMAQALIMECGGAAYLAEPMVAELLAAGRLFRVDDAAVIERTAYAVYPGNSSRSATIGTVLGYFSPAGVPTRVGA